MSNSVQPHRQQPTRLRHPWDSPGNNTGVGRHFLLQCTKVKSESEVAQSCPTLLYPMDSSPPAPPFMGFARQEYWSGVPLPSPVSSNQLWWRKVQPSLQVRAKKVGGSCSKGPKSLMVFRGVSLKTTFGGAGFWWGSSEATGWHFRDLTSLLVPPSMRLVLGFSSSSQHPLPQVRVVFPKEQLQRYLSKCYVYPLRRKWNPALSLTCYYFSCLTTFPLLLHSLTPLISNCMGLCFATSERAKRRKSFSTQKKWGTQRGFGTQESPTGSCCFKPPPPFFFDTPQSWGKQMQDEKGNKALDREVNHKLGRGTWF